LACDESPWTPVVALAGALLLATLLQSLGAIAGRALRTSLFVLPPLRIFDTAAGVLLGAVMGLALVWVGGAVALHVPGQTRLREEVQQSRILRELNGRVPPNRLLDAIERVDPFLQIPGPLARVDPPDPALLRDPGVRAARGSVLRVTGTACGLGVSGSGWIARPEIVVTNAHVVAGVDDARIDRGEGPRLEAHVIAFDTRNDVAVLRVPGLEGAPLRLVEPERGAAVAILGYPQSGPFTATAGRIGQTGPVFTDDAYGRGPVSRSITTVRGEIRRGNSGGPAVDSRGRVQTTIFASRIGSASGFGVPTPVVRRALERARARAVSTGPCVLR
jgi:S1-C subfamily serine protease